MRSLKTVSFMTPKSFGVDLNLREWRVGEKKLPVGDVFAIARRLLLQTWQQQRMAACSHTAARFPNLKIPF
jgi:hypothetical protein